MSDTSGRRTYRDSVSHGQNESNPTYDTVDNGDGVSGTLSPMPENIQLMNDLLVNADEAIYEWHVRSDQFKWGPKAKDVLRLPPELAISSHDDLLRHIGRKSATERLEAIQSATEVSDLPSSFCVAYKFYPDPWDHENFLWIEERGVGENNGADGSLVTRGVMRVVTDHRVELDNLKFWATRDEVTGQLNRPQLIRELDNALTLSRQNKSSSVFLLAAVENLAFINETFGYAIGDEVLSVIGQRFSNTLRSKDCIGRHSANKFGIILHDCGPEAMQHVAKRLLGITKGAPIRVADTTLTVTLGIGGVLIPDQADDVQETLSAAHEALDYARIGHQNKFAAYCKNSKRAETRAHFKLMADEIMEALNENRMVLALQPIVSSNNSEVAFYECLVRMRRENGELVSARDIIPVAEKLGLTGYLDHRVLEMAIEILRADDNITLSLNVSGQTTSDHDWLIALHKLTQGERAIRERLIIEITETSAIRDLDETVNFVDTLQDMGCRVAIDDFGAGYTSFQNLRFFGVDMVKIDGSFVSNITSDADNLLFVETLIDLSKKFGLETVVEWVVDEDVAELMRGAGANYLQGSLFGMPTLASISTEEFLENETEDDDASSSAS